MIGYKIPTNSIIAISLLSLYVLGTSSWFTTFVSAQGSPTEETRTPITLIPAQNTLTIVSLLIGTSSFILGLRIQNLTRSPATTTPISALMNKYFELLILALAIPSVIIIVFGIIIVGIQLDPGDFAYLLLLFALFISAGAVLFLVKQLRKFSAN
ncbi:MAG: hypothetical protein WBV84_14315 [Nitrososphaeraceae archaeon]